MTFREIVKPVGKLKISKIFINKRNGQVSIILPKKKLKRIPNKVEVSYW